LGINASVGDSRRIDDGYAGIEFGDFVCWRSRCLGRQTPYYKTIQAAFSAASAGNTIQAAKTLAAEKPVWAKTGTVTISGGWKTDFSGQDGTTSMYAPRATGGGGVKVMPNVKIIPKP